MIKGILLGLASHIAFTVGFLFISQATFVKNQLLKTMLSLCFSAVLVAIIVAYLFLSGAEEASLLQHKDLRYLALGSVLVLVVGDTLFIAGLSASNVTVMTYTALASPAVALLLEASLGRIRLTPRDLLGFALLALGFIVIARR